MGKIRASLAAIIDSEEVNSTYYKIAKYLLKNNYIVKHVSIDDVAKNCYCAKSTVSRFARQIGYDNYYELNQDLYISTTKSQDKYNRYMSMDYEDTKNLFLNDLKNSIIEAEKSITETSVNKLVMLINEHKDVGIFGNLQSSSMAQTFQHDMGLSKKIITSSLLPEYQRTYIEGSDSHTLIIIVSFSGDYFRHFIHHNSLLTQRPYIVLITCNEKMKDNKYYDDVIYLSCNDNYAARAHVISLYLNLVAIEYAKVCSKH